MYTSILVFTTLKFGEEYKLLSSSFCNYVLYYTNLCYVLSSTTGFYTRPTHVLNIAWQSTSHTCYNKKEVKLLTPLLFFQTSRASDHRRAISAFLKLYNDYLLLKTRFDNRENVHATSSHAVSTFLEISRRFYVHDLKHRYFSSKVHKFTHTSNSTHDTSRYLNHQRN
jgi:hypothetical protein